MSASDPTRPVPAGDGASYTRLLPGQIVVDRQRTADLVRSHHALWKALDSIRCLVDASDLLISASRDASAALAAEPEFDQLPAFVQVAESWGDAVLVCVACDQPVAWRDALLVPHRSARALGGIVHRDGCWTGPSESGEETEA